jgi:hypothetical protein
MAPTFKWSHENLKGTHSSIKGASDQEKVTIEASPAPATFKLCVTVYVECLHFTPVAGVFQISDCESSGCDVFKIA